MEYQILLNKFLPDVTVFLYKEISSTHKKAKSIIMNNEGKSGLCLIALKQSDGIGQYNRKWYNSEDSQLSMTLLINLTSQKINKNNNKNENILFNEKESIIQDFNKYLWQLSYMTCVSIGESLILIEKINNSQESIDFCQNYKFILNKLNINNNIENVLHISNNLYYKWVNDIFLGNLKLGGVLHEVVNSIDIIDTWLLVSIGINIKGMPIISINKHNNKITEKLTHASFLAQFGINIDPINLAYYIIHEWFKQYKILLRNGFIKIKKSWLKRALFLGEKIFITNELYKESGIFIGIDDYGRLMIQNDENEIKTIIHGSMYKY
ncbi:biotin--[acetyl-CoA-carboxylase] ligase [Lyticum sinuosum]|uniref:Biotin--[acetyl-CoA-carboxylase] ligase n=1 Tax=Lyticum sinuosum TaxID=1332059 RepID=A0AAE5AHL3_9RICK|nr:hypothetical protein [Lyticum sinuosum]MDZ5761161.1 Biotin--[acetyl-CoA-carboxylase] ligase [Lyticum sinuosum]